MEKCVHKGFTALFAFVFFLLIGAYAIPQNQIYNPGMDVKARELLPESEEVLPGGVTRMKLHIGEREEESDTLFVEALHTEVAVFLDGKELYSLKRGQKPWMNTTGTVYSLIYLPEQAEELQVEMRNLYPKIPGNRAEFYLGNGAEIAGSLTRGSFFPSIISALDVFMGILMLVFWFLFRRVGNANRGLFYLAFFSIAIGAWSMTESNNFILIVSDHAASSFTSFVSLMLLIVPLVQFTKYYYERHSKFADILSAITMAVQVILILLHITAVAGLKQTVTITHLLMLVAGGYHVLCFFESVRTERQKKRVMVNIIAVVILVSSSIVDFYMYFSGNMQATFAGRFGIMVYLFLLGMEMVKQMLEELRLSRKVAIYKELAYKDNLTGLFNRNAYMDWERNMTEPKEVSIINIDLNDLKMCNDKYGHVNGDRYIADSAFLIYETFYEVGKCYRIGGDEFAIVIEPECSEERIKQLLQILEQKQEEYNKKSEIVQMHMAYGYAKFDLEKDKTVESVGSRADARMYAHKKEIKELTGGTIR